MAKASVLKRRPAPTRGWNASDPLHSMDKADAIILQNYFPRTGDVTTRNGHASHATGMVGTVETLASYSSGSTVKMVAAANGNIWDCSSAGAAVSLASGFTNNRWQTVQFRNRLIFVNGVDNPQYYDGTSVAVNAFSSATATVLTDNDFIAINAFKKRLFLIEENQLRFWYAPVDTASGALSDFDLTGVFRMGGKLMAMGNWTRDGGDGMDDLAVFVSSRGEVAVYQGTDPATAADWELIGVFRIGEPVGRRCLVNFGSDLVIITRDGFISCDRQLSLDRSTGGYSQSLSSRIGSAVNDATRSYGSNFGWQACLYPKGTYLLFNVPLSAIMAEQYVVNTITGAWCRFTGQAAFCWTLFNDELYFGSTSGVVYKADTGTSDNGVNIVCDMLTAFSDDSMVGRKMYRMMRPYLTRTGTVALNTNVDLDYNTAVPTDNYPDLPAISGATFGTAIFGISLFSSSSEPVQSWTTLTGIGMVGALRMRFSSTTATVTINGFDLIIQPGGLF